MSDKTLEALARLTAYVTRRKRAKGIDIESIHGFDVGPDCGLELLLSDIEALLAATEQAPAAVTVPEGWKLETGVGSFDDTRWVCVRNLKSQCGQDFYEDRDPLIFAFLSAFTAANSVPEADQPEERQ